MNEEQILLNQTTIMRALAYLITDAPNIGSRNFVLGWLEMRRTETDKILAEHEDPAP